MYPLLFTLFNIKLILFIAHVFVLNVMSGYKQLSFGFTKDFWSNYPISKKKMPKQIPLNSEAT